MKLFSRIRAKILSGIGKMLRAGARAYGRAWARRHAIALRMTKYSLSALTIGLTLFAFNYYLPVWMTCAIASTVFVHHLGHFVTAKRLHRDVDPPLFLGIFGTTRVHDRGMMPVKDAQIQIAGPTWGFIWAAAGAAFAFYFAQNTIMWTFIWLGAFNLFQGTIGSDGRFYQAMKKETDIFSYPRAAYDDVGLNFEPV